MSTPRYGEPPKGPSRMVVSSIPICPWCKNKDFPATIDELRKAYHGDVGVVLCMECGRMIAVQVLVYGDHRTYRSAHFEARNNFPKLPEEMVKR